MMNTGMDNFKEIKSEKLLSNSVSEILKHEDYERYRQWLQVKLPDYMGEGMFPLEAPQALHALATILSRAVWNAVPLPGNGFRPSPLPTPGRNDPCPCGSGAKYKKCCASLPALPPLHVQTLWPLVLEKLPRDTVQQLLAARKIPIESLVDKAEDLRDHGQPKKALSLLLPLFHGEMAGTDSPHEFALEMVFNLYDELGSYAKKQKLIQQVIGTAPASPPRAGAYQRLAAIRMDQGDHQGAWDAFQKARSDDPDNPMIGVLEVHLLVAEKRTDEARERSRFPAKRLQRLGYKEDETPLNFLIEASQDPVAALSNVGSETTGSAVERLKQWIRKAADRPVPLYFVVTDTPGSDLMGDSLSGTADRMKKLGIPLGQIPKLEAAWQRQLKALEDETGDEESRSRDPEMLLMPSEEIEKLEEGWQEVVPLGKPFSVNPYPFENQDIWDPGEEDDWMEFLEDHPQAFDSLEIIDDLATAVYMHPESDLPFLENVLLEPLLRRAHAIIDAVLRKHPGLRLNWGFVENRPPLRLLARLTSLCVQRGDDREARELAEQMLALNPNDNHGFRCLVMDHCLRSGEEQKALQLADRYPDDGSPELLYGRVLALYRMDRLVEAGEAARRAVKSRPKVLHYLIAKRVRKPEMHPSWVTLGGDDEAWFYREQMREVWLATPGVVSWLKKISSMKSGRG